MTLKSISIWHYAVKLAGHALISLGIGVVFLLILALASMAQTVPHDQSDPNHWYPEDCCSGRDCEALPDDAVIEEPLAGKEGWRVRYVSRLLGRVDTWVPKKHTHVNVNEHDGKFHGCFNTGGAPGLMSPSDTKTSFICFWYPVNM